MLRFKLPICTTYDAQQDSLLHWKFLALPCLLLAYLTTLYNGATMWTLIPYPIEYLWNFSIYLESVAILPQQVVLARYGEVENLTGRYIFFMGAYRFLYILNWVYRAYTEENYEHHYVVYFCGVLQTALYADFFYYYFKAKGGKFSLPNSHSN